VYPPSDCLAAIIRYFKLTKRKDNTTMIKDNVIDLKKPELFIDDPITDILRQGARRLLTDALKAEIKTLYKTIHRHIG
jgi:hypothetical protein